MTANVRHKQPPRALGEPKPDCQATTWLTAAELAEVDRRAASAGLSRSAFLRSVLLADADACAALQEILEARDERIVELERQLLEQRQHLAAQVAHLEMRLDQARLRYARELAHPLPSGQNRL